MFLKYFLITLMIQLTFGKNIKLIFRKKLIIDIPFLITNTNDTDGSTNNVKPAIEIASTTFETVPTTIEIAPTNNIIKINNKTTSFGTSGSENASPTNVIEDEACESICRVHRNDIITRICYEITGISHLCKTGYCRDRYTQQCIKIPKFQRIKK